MKVAVVTPMMKSGEKGGAEALYEGLIGALRRFSHDVDQVPVVIDESSFGAILDSYARCAELDLGVYDVVVSTKAPTYMVRHPNHVSYLIHTIRVFYDMFEREYGAGTQQQITQRAAIQALDRLGLGSELVRGRFTIGHTNYRRLQDADPFWKDVSYEVASPAPILTGFREPKGPGSYFFAPGRLHRWKRTDLIIRAFRELDHDIPLK